jgi:hypothetical protein
MIAPALQLSDAYVTALAVLQICRTGLGARIGLAAGR